nr:hypothetical protein [Tanacetum cinerariifolium]
MTSFGHRSNPSYTIKECSSCGTLYTRDCVCSKENVVDKILVLKPPKNYAWCTRCGYLVDGPNCQGCALLRQKLEENLVTHSPDFQNTSEPSNASTNVVNAPREPYIVKQDKRSFLDKIFFDLNRAPDSPHLHTLSLNQFRCFHCKDVLRDGEACKRSGGPFNCDLTPTYVDESLNVSNPPPQPLVYLCEFCENDAYYGHYCTPQAPFIYPEPCYNQDFNFPQDFQNVPQQYPCCDDCGERSDSLDDNIISGLPPFSVIAPNEPVLSTEEPDNSLSMGNEHLDTILTMKSDEFIKSSVENLIPIPSESKGIPEHMCDVPFHDNSPPLDVSKDQIENLSESTEEFSSIDDDSFFIDNIDYVEASPPESELVSSEVMEIVIPEVGGIDDDILLTIKDDILREKLLNVNLLIAKIKALNANPTPSSYCKTKSSSTSLNSLLEETNTFHNSLPEFETFCFD